MSDLTLHSQPVLDPFEALIRLFQGLPRKGPGLERSTLQALACCRPLPPSPAVLDLGCGSGASTLVLARTLGTPITAVDACAPFLAELERHAAEQGLSEHIRTLCLDFGTLDFAPGSFDLLWSEGAIYHLGWEAGLRAWRPLVRPGGFLVLTEAVWFVDHPPEAARAAWSQWYPALGTTESCLQTARALGLDPVAAFPLPPEGWRDYYAPLVQRCRDWAPDADPALAEAIAEMQEEMEVYRASQESYGYAFFILRVP